MKTEDIQKAAIELAKEKINIPIENFDYESEWKFKQDVLRKAFTEAFTDGARWYSENIWHSSEEKPKPISCCLVEYIDEEVDDEFTNYEVTHYVTDNVGFIGDFKDKKITRWADVKDLLPIKFK